VRLPSTVDASKVEASYNDGVMTIRLPKVEAANRSRILIN
jgi:HSP20 family molecular chaperone IbpA